MGSPTDGSWVKGYCGRMDHGGCGLLLKIVDGKLVSVKGDEHNPRSRGHICSKGLAAPERIYHPDRLRQPLRRAGARGSGRWEPMSWEEALRFASERLASVKSAHGARAVAFCQGAPRGLEFILLYRLAYAFGSPNVVGISNVCHMPREFSARMTMGFFPVVDYDNPAKCYLVWGSNILATNEEGVLAPLLLRRLNEGSPLIVVDPLKTELARRADLWLQIRPGSDVALALGFLNIIIHEKIYDEHFVEHWTYGFEELARAVAPFTPEKVAELTWVGPDLIREAARVFGRARPGAVQWGNAIEHTIHSFDACRAICCLMAVTGNLDVPGGNIQAGTAPVVPPPSLGLFGALPRKEEERVSGAHGLVDGFPVVPPPLFVRAALEAEPYPIRAAYVQANNPVMSWPDSRRTEEALKSLEFLCVSDIFMSPTAALADLVLPAATHFEFDDIGHYGLPYGFVLARRKIIDPPPSCWPDIKILNEMAKYLGLARDWWDDTEQILAEILRPSGITYAQFAEKGILMSPVEFRKYESRGFPTPSGKVELRSEAAERRGLPPVPVFSGFPEELDSEFPLLLSSAKSRYYFHSAYRQLPGLRRKNPNPLLRLHPRTAAGLGIEAGDQVRVTTKQGSIVLSGSLSDAVDPRVVYSEHGWYFPESGESALFDCMKSNLNVLTSTDCLGQAFGTPNLRGVACRVSKT